MLEPVRVAVVGPGLMGRQHIRLIKENPRCRLVAVVGLEADIRICGVGADDNVRFYQSLDHCLTEQEPGAVVISSPNRLHAEQAGICIHKHLPVLIEKPLAVSVVAGEQLVRLVRETGAKVLVGHHRVHSPIIARAKEVVESGRLGRPVSIMGSAQFCKPTQYFWEGPWRKEVGGGPILINLIHEVGNFRSLLGEVTAVQATASSAIRSFPVEDTVAICFRFGNGALGTLLLSDTAATAKSWEQTSGENTSYPSYPAEDCYAIAGTRGSLSIPTMRLRYYGDGVDPSWWSPFVEETLPLTRSDPLVCQLNHFLDIVEDKAEPLVSAADGLRNLRITEAVAESTRSGQLVCT